MTPKKPNLTVNDFPGVIIRPDAFKVEVFKNNLYVTYHLHTEIFTNPKNDSYLNIDGLPNCIKIDNELLPQIKNEEKPINLSIGKSNRVVPRMHGIPLARIVLNLKEDNTYIIFFKDRNNLNCMKENLFLNSPSYSKVLGSHISKHIYKKTDPKGKEVLVGRIAYNGVTYSRSCTLDKYGKEETIRILSEFISKHLDNINNILCAINNKKGSYVDVS